MNTSKKHWGIVGGGMLGMHLAHRLAQQGHAVTLMEGASQLGGLTSTWQLGEVIWDKYYHVILLSDTKLRELLSELKLDSEMEWVQTKTGFYTDGHLHSMSDTIEFLTFPPLSLIDKLRLGFTIFYASKVKNWKRLEGVYVTDWLKKWSGKNTFEKIWLPLLRAKLGEDYETTSAAFIWATIQRMYAARRTGLKKEMFGYVKGGYARILDTFQQLLQSEGVAIRTGFQAASVETDEEGGVVVTNREGEALSFDEVVLTVPSPVATSVCKGLGAEEKQLHQQINYLGVICASLLLRKSLSPFYVTNVTDNPPFTGVIEMTNLVDRKYFDGLSLIYLPKYVNRNHAFFQKSDEEVREIFWNTMLKMYEGLREEDLVTFQIVRAPNVFAQSTLRYSEKLPPVSTQVPGVHILNSAHIINGTLNVNETLLVVERELPHLLRAAAGRPSLSKSHG